MASLKGNVILNGINTFTSILFPIITFPYAARILLPEGIGVVNFQNSIIGYIILFTSLGIPLYATKEIAKFKNDKKLRDKLTIEIGLLSVLLCVIGYAIVWVIATYIPAIHAQMALFYVLSLSILFTTIGVQWFYQGIEDFKFITIRAVIIRTLAAISLFLFVHSPKDIIIYGLIIVSSTVGNNLINFIHLRNHLSFVGIKISELNIFRHAGPAFQVFVLNLITSLYLQLNTIMLGFISGDDAVGFFTAGTRISHIGLVVISSVATVMLPRCSNLLQTNEIEEFNRVINKSLRFMQFLSYPITIGLITLAVPITIIFCGPEYYDSIPVLLFNAPVIIFISLTNLMGLQVLYPMDKIKLVIISVAFGAVLNLILNFLLIPSMQATGASISTFVAELGVLILQVILGRKYMPFRTSGLVDIRSLTAALIMGAFVYLATFKLHEYWLMLVVGIPLGIVVYSIISFLLKDTIAMEFYFIIKNKFLK